ncbi:hypothetical protein PHYBOEH_004389 [Phytophthora boehmeriae]|uniref:PAP/OAS1 substrate-binding-related domain-containing protein n=1 Tax=Phytophthora boehmeriae TaxID=109152 RepID=A0A8T1WM58_9STRA|nr:hypothetical protein PHYBOEH_004389 [Phytophthora boehmeriae]
MKTDKTTLQSAKSSTSRHARKKKNKQEAEAFDEVDARIQIPMATRLKMQMNRKMNAQSPSEDTRLLRSGIDQYRSLQHLSSDSRRSRAGSDHALERGLALVDRKQFAAAIPYFTEALSAAAASRTDAAASSSVVKLHHQRGLCYLAAQKYKPAIEDLSKVMQLTPKSAELYAKRGKAYAAMGEHHAALLDYNEAINLAATQGLLRDGMDIGDGVPSFQASASLVQLRGLYLARAKVYKALNNITHALEDLGQAENSAGGHRDSELFYERAQLYLQCHQDPLALQDLDRFLELQEDAEESRHFDASGGVGGLAGFGAPPEPETGDSRGRMLDVLLERAKVLQRMAMEEDQRERKDVELSAVEQGQTTQSSKKTFKPGKNSPKLTHLSSLSPPKPEPYLGIESRRLEKRALHDYSRVLELDSNNVDALRLRGEALMHLAHYEDALMDFSRAVELDPDDFQVPMARAQLYRQQGDLKAAVEETTRVLRTSGFFINGLFLRARLYEELGDVENAQKDYTSIIEAHFDIRGGEKSVTSGKVTMELASGGTLSPAGHGGRTSSTSGKNGKTGGCGQGGKITSEVAARALLQRARLSMASEQFDSAEKDYSRILDSFSNNMEAQLELQETKERKAALEERKHREALAWLERNADETDGAGVLNANGSNNTSSGKSKKKKRKKKKKAQGGGAVSSSGKPPAGYVLLEDEEELLQQQQQEQQENGQPQRQQKNGQETQQIILSNNLQDKNQEGDQEKSIATTEAEISTSASETEESSEVVAVTKAIVEGKNSESVVVVAPEVLPVDYVNDQGSFSNAARPIEESRHHVDERIVTTSNTESNSAVIVTSVMTRDEAWESMWDEDADEPLEIVTETNKSRMHTSIGDHVHTDDPAGIEAEPVNDPDGSVSKAQTSLPADSATTGDDEQANDDASGSSDDGKDAQGKTKAVLVDDKYLRKREKQLRKLRESLQHASEERDKNAIDDALARAERKQMSDALQEDIQRARNVLADMEVNAQRIRDSVPPAVLASSTTSSSEHGRKHLHTVTSPSSTISSNSKPPSLVIRPIAYGQALQAAEQHQQQLRTHQKLLEEKDAEIAHLKQLLAQNTQATGSLKRQENTQKLEVRAQAKKAALARRVTRLRTHFPCQGAAANQAEALVEWMGPSDAADRVRQQILAFVQRVITAHFPLAAAPLFFATGSYPMKTYLPTSDLDICLLVPQELESSWYYVVMQALCVAGGSGGVGTVLDIGNAASGDGSGGSSPSGPGSTSGSGGGGTLLLTNTVRNVTFINADVRVIKCTVDNIAVDFTANRVGALGAVRLLDAMAVRVGCGHLFKKSLILIKSWCTHESSSFLQAASAEVGGVGPSIPGSSTPSSVMGASHGALSTYAVNTIVMALFNHHGDALTHPLQALYLFLDRLAEFPWHEAALTLHGTVPLSRLAITPLNGTTSTKIKHKSAKLNISEVEAIRSTLVDQFGSFDAGLKGSGGMFPIRACNIVDPLDDKNNLARSVSAESFPVLKRAFKLARDQLAAMIAPRTSHKDADTEILSDETGGDVGKVFFARCWQLYGRGDGWRPDLLIHPRQIWHGKAASSSSTGSASAKSKSSPRPRATSASPVMSNGVHQTSDEDEDRRWESLLPSLDIGAANALLLQHQQLQQQAAAAAAAAAYHHGTMIAYQQPYFPQQQHGLPVSGGTPGPAGPVVMTNGVAAASAGPAPSSSAEQAFYRRPYGSPGGGSQRSKSPPPLRHTGQLNGKTTPLGRRQYDSPPQK